MLIVTYFPFERISTSQTQTKEDALPIRSKGLKQEAKPFLNQTCTEFHVIFFLTSPNRLCKKKKILNSKAPIETETKVSQAGPNPTCKLLW